MGLSQSHENESANVACEESKFEKGNDPLRLSDGKSQLPRETYWPVENPSNFPLGAAYQETIDD